MLNLFDSIRKQYPIGTLLFWESTKVRPMSDHLGPLALPDNSAGKLLVLDGQQRLTTLAGVLLFDELERSSSDDRDPGRWIIYYDAAADGFAYLDGDEPLVSAVRVSELMGTKGIYAAAKRIMASGGATTADPSRALAGRGGSSASRQCQPRLRRIECRWSYSLPIPCA